MSQLYTLDEVKQHNGKNGAKTWIVIRDIVYDVTEFLNEVSDLSQQICLSIDIENNAN